MYFRKALYIQVHLKKLEYREKVNFFIVTFQKVKLAYILDSLNVKKNISKVFLF